MDHTPIKLPKKLIEVSLPLDDINIASAAEKQPGIGAHPRGLHLWWARRPLATARAVLFAQLVNDPGYERHLKRGMNKEKAQEERERLFGIIRRLVKWENTNNESVLNEARAEIRQSWQETCDLNKGHPDASTFFDPNNIPAFHDPFAGGGAIPLEAQRLGLESWATDLNPVAVLINKAMIEFPPKFVGNAPVGPIPKDPKYSKKYQSKFHQDWSGTKGLVEDVQRYGIWIQEQAVKRIGHLFPPAVLPKELGGAHVQVIAWIWARTVKSPNPAFSHVDVPLASSFFLSTKKGKEAWVEPIINGDSYTFTVQTGLPKKPEITKNGTKLATGANFRCILSDTPIDPAYIKKEALEGRMGAKLLAVVAESKAGRLYLPPTPEMESIANSISLDWKPEVEFFQQALGFRIGNYGMTKWSDLFTPRQLKALTTFSDLIVEASKKVVSDAIAARWTDDGISLDAGGKGATAYSDAIAVYLSFALSRLADYNSSICTWKPSGEQVMQTYKRQALPMTWDFPESNILGDKSICWLNAIKYTKDNLASTTGMTVLVPGHSLQQDAQNQKVSYMKVVSTDPPYYDNIGYADLSDFFYVWLRRTLKERFPNLLGTIAVPKAEELVATPHRHGGRQQAEQFFLSGMTQCMHQLAVNAHPAFPVSIYYAFKQTDTTDGGTSSTGWQTFLDAVIRSGFAITGTWPMRTELGNRIRGADSNALASSIVLVCKQRPVDAATLSRKEFLSELKATLPDSLETMIGGKGGHSPIAPVDLAQAAIGPGMAVFSKYAAILEADGQPMTIQMALTLINKSIDDYFNEAEVELDSDTRFCVSWFEEFGWNAAAFGEADVLARAKGTSVDNVRTAGVIESGAGKVRLLKVPEYPSDWNPTQDKRTPAWEAVHHLIRALNSGGETEAGTLLAGMPERTEIIRSLAYRLYTLCERKGWSEEARFYNELITSWHAIEAASHQIGRHGEQMKLNI